jgi:hypothetical protein
MNSASIGRTQGRASTSHMDAPSAPTRRSASACTAWGPGSGERAASAANGTAITNAPIQAIQADPGSYHDRVQPAYNAPEPRAAPSTMSGQRRMDAAAVQPVSTSVR